MKVWNDKDAMIGYWNLLLDGREVLLVHDLGDTYKLHASLGSTSVEAFLEKNSDNGEAYKMKASAEKWYAEKLEEHIASLETALEQSKTVLKALSGPENEKLVDIFDLEYDGEGYMHFHVMADGYELEGLYRLYDPANGPDMTLVSIDYGYLHPIIERQWDRIEMALYDRSLNRYHDILDKSEAFKEKVIAGMEAAGYTYDVLESHEGWETFYGEGGVRMGFDRLHEAAEWLEGVVFDDPGIGRRVEEIMHPERAEKPLDDVLEDAAARADKSLQMDAKETEKEGLF